jgi:hypothetical protein
MPLGILYNCIVWFDTRIILTVDATSRQEGLESHSVSSKPSIAIEKSKRETITKQTQYTFRFPGGYKTISQWRDEIQPCSLTQLGWPDIFGRLLLLVLENDFLPMYIRTKPVKSRAFPVWNTLFSMKHAFRYDKLTVKAVQMLFWSPVAHRSTSACVTSLIYVLRTGCGAAASNEILWEVLTKSGLAQSVRWHDVQVHKGYIKLSDSN